MIGILEINIKYLDVCYYDFCLDIYYISIMWENLSLVFLFDELKMIDGKLYYFENKKYNYVFNIKLL